MSEQKGPPEYYRRTPMLEQRGLEKLPPTPITNSARVILESWGLPKEVIPQIQEFCASFRYDRCAEKVTNLAEVPLRVGFEGNTEVLEVPYFFDSNGRLDGQCGDIGRQFIIQAEISGLIEDLNSVAQLPHGFRIVSCFCNGLSKTHFSQEGMNHVWNGLAVIDTQGVMQSYVLIDAAFQQISELGESLYELRSTVADPNHIDSEAAGRIELGWIKIKGSEWSGNIRSSLTLGLSNDRKYAYVMSFAMNRDLNASQAIIPLIGRVDAEARIAHFFINPENGNMMTHGVSEPLTESELEEMTALLGACNLFKYTEEGQLPPNQEFTFMWPKDNPNSTP